MKKSISILAVVLTLTILTHPLAAKSPTSDSLSSRQLAEQTGQAENHLVRLRIDTTGSVIQVAPPSSRDVINSSFDFVSANCVNCATPCPPIPRTVEVILQANTNIAAGYGVSDLTSANYSVPATGGVAYSTQAALSAGQLITVTITGQVLNCENWFNVYFSMCNNEPSNPADECPAAAPASCQEILSTNPAAFDDVYWIDPDGPFGVPQFEVFCDMSTRDGGWTVVFSGNDPLLWGMDFGSPGMSPWSHDFSALPFAMDKVLLSWPATGQSTLVDGILIAQLYQCTQGTNGLWWDGSAWFGFGALHLGVCNNVGAGSTPGYVVSCGQCNNDSRSRGFGHLNLLNNQQGWGWDSTDLGLTEFVIAVR